MVLRAAGILLQQFAIFQKFIKSIPWLFAVACRKTGNGKPSQRFKENKSFVGGYRRGR